jgi:hypothetical protein
MTEMTDRDALALLRAIGQDMGVVASVLMRTARDGNDDQKSIERLNAWRGEILAVMDALSTPPPAPTDEAAQAYGYLSRLFTHCAPKCEPLPDLMGVCTQIDNLIVGMRTPPPADLVALVAEWRQAVTAPLVPPPEMDDNAARTLYRRARSDRADAAHKALLAYPLPAAPPVTDTPQGWTREPRR